VSQPKVDVHRAGDGTRLYRVSTPTNSKRLVFTEDELADLIRQAQTVLRGTDALTIT